LINIHVAHVQKPPINVRLWINSEVECASQQSRQVDFCGDEKEEPSLFAATSG